MNAEHSTGSRAIMTISMLVALEFFSATRRMLEDARASLTLAQATGIPGHILEDLKSGHLPVSMEDVVHWLANVCAHADLPRLENYLSDDAAGRVLLNLELLLRES